MQTIVMPGPLVTAEAERVAKLRVTELDAASLPDSLSFFEWVEVFSPFIAETIEGGVHTYALDENRAPAGDYAVAARISCAVVNALPPENRIVGAEVVPEPYVLDSDFKIAAATPCQDIARWNTYVWGGSLYMNHCLIVDVNAYVGNAARIGALIAASLAAAGVTLPASIVIASISAFLAVNAAWLLQADQHCGGTGAFLQIPWISIGTPFVKQNC